MGHCVNKVFRNVLTVSVVYVHIYMCVYIYIYVYVHFGTQY